MQTEDRVLLIEDSKSFAAILKGMIFEAHGFEVDVAEDLATTNAILASSANEYFVAIVDYHLPDAADGEAIDAVVAYEIPAIVFTGSGKALEEDLWPKSIADYASKTGAHNLEYVSRMVKRIFLNRSVEVLVVDDSKISCRYINALLNRQKFIVHTVQSGNDALAFLQDNKNTRIVIVDYHMDGMSGFELCTQLREIYSRAKLEIVGISSNDDRKTAAQFIKSGANEFVPKPIIPEEFLCRINNAADRIGSYIELDKLNNIKNQFLGTAAHDIRGPLGSIKTAADFLITRSPSDERKKILLKMIQNSSVELLKLLDTLLDVSVIESGIIKIDLAQTNISDCLQERIDLYQSEARLKSITLHADITPGIMAEVDQVKLKQVIDNLITNAIKYSEPDSSVGVRLAKRTDTLTLSVQDSGPGISKSEQEHLFKAFSVLSTKATGGEKKTGLGLAIAKSIVDAHKGKVYYQHNDHCHSTFFVDIPLHSEVK